jgi:serine/threonine-protein kinase
VAEALGCDLEAANAYQQLAGIAGSEQHDYTTGHRLIALARAKFERAGHGDADQAALLAVEGDMLQDELRAPEAVTALRRTIALATEEYGQDHPMVGMLYGNLGTSLLAVDRSAAVDAETQAVAILERALGDDHPMVASALLNLGYTLQLAGRITEARERLLRADAIFSRALEPDAPVRGKVFAALANVEQALEHWDAARDDLDRALAIVARTSGPESVDAGDVHYAIAYLLGARGRFAESEAEGERALAILEKAIGATHPQLVNSLLLIAKAALADGHARAALPAAERAVDIIDKQPGYPPVEAAEPRFVLAQVLWETHGDRLRARSLAEQARATAVEPSFSPAQIDEWLASHSLAAK